MPNTAPRILATVPALPDRSRATLTSANFRRSTLARVSVPSTADVTVNPVAVALNVAPARALP